MLPTVERNSRRVIEDACHTVAEYCYGHCGLWLYRAFDWINHTLFSDELQYPHIVIGLTAHGGCLAWSLSRDATRPPTILVHPSCWCGTEVENPWGIAPDILGPRFVFDVLIHETIHVSVQYRLGGRSGGDSSHNNPQWVSELERIAPLLGFEGVKAGMSKVTRQGKRVRRVSQDNVPFEPAVPKFPSGLRAYRGQIDYYRDRSPPPFECNLQPYVTGTREISG